MQVSVSAVNAPIGVLCVSSVDDPEEDLTVLATSLDITTGSRRWIVLDFTICNVVTPETIRVFQTYARTLQAAGGDAVVVVRPEQTDLRATLAAAGFDVLSTLARACMCLFARN
jgi:hypothetical protein